MTRFLCSLPDRPFRRVVLALLLGSATACAASPTAPNTPGGTPVRATRGHRSIAETDTAVVVDTARAPASPAGPGWIDPNI